MRKIYLDNAATTQPLAICSDIYTEYAQELWQNPSALYADATRVQTKVEEAKKTLLRAFGSSVHRCVFTSCGSESANMVILRGARQKKNMNYVCGGAEHPCVEESFKYLAEQGYPVTFIKPDRHGVITPAQVAEAVDADTALVSVMHVNNETGAKNDIEKIAAAVKAKNAQAMFHADGVQAYCKERLTNTSNIDYYTVSAHKLHAHKGTGAVFYKENTPLKPYILGGGQEGGLRSGTQNTLGIFSFAAAVSYFMEEADKEQAGRVRDIFLEACSGIEDIVLLTPEDSEQACRHIVNLSVLGVRGETLLHTLEQQGICISTGSACSSKKGKSRIAKALGLSEEEAEGAIRISFSPFTTQEEVLTAAAQIKKEAELLRRFTRK
ncbi:MAG: cysteine desulfurase family protein [Christensenella sp.]|uniref:cysteine desulfurase family protein n=1 Tax=Christensenella sp. TaxID=1935934 RepID=UPI002B1ECB46|nr:cysteine desulfurase family protein [Christensenella sp.]MEA5002592.1 cysteine desulfurase family protein [Christensenella sp.]